MVRVPKPATTNLVHLLEGARGYHVLGLLLGPVSNEEPVHVLDQPLQLLLRDRPVAIQQK